MRMTCRFDRFRESWQPRLTFTPRQSCCFYGAIRSSSCFALRVGLSLPFKTNQIDIMQNKVMVLEGVPQKLERNESLRSLRYTHHRARCHKCGNFASNFETKFNASTRNLRCFSSSPLIFRLEISHSSNNLSLTVMLPSIWINV